MVSPATPFRSIARLWPREVAAKNTLATRPSRALLRECYDTAATSNIPASSHPLTPAATFSSGVVVADELYSRHL